MADKKISALPAASTPLAGSEVLPIVQGGITEQVSVANLTAGRTVSATGYTATAGNVVVAENYGISFGIGSTYLYGSTTNGYIRLDVNNATAFGVDSSRNATVNVGNLVIGTAGKGIDFSANTHAAGMTSELLNDYEEGTWTPTGGSFGATGSSGTYTRIGRQVTVNAIFTGTMTFGASSVICSNLPFSALAGSDFAGGIVDAASSQGAFMRANTTFLVSCSGIAVPVSTLAATVTYFV